MKNNKILKEGSEPEVEKTPDGVDIGTGDGKTQIVNSEDNTAQKNDGFRRFLHGLLIIAISVISVIIIIVFTLYIVPCLQEISLPGNSEINNNHVLKKDPAYKKQITLMSKDIQQLSRKYNTYTSEQSYIVINTTGNKFSLYKNKKLVREGLCSSGANKILQTQKKTYVFKTPKGKFSITGKRTHPYWHRSDWDFIEQGLVVPPKDDPSRWEEGVLGDYALDLVDGYMIHGTIYKRLMGMPVTHGCVRLGDKDLEIVYNTLNIGSKVYIF
jgi:lipoprotein-anchoring transpeptidase ErfK/SrfK